MSFFEEVGNTMGSVAQTAITKSKNLAEITKLTLDINASEDQIKTAKLTVGNYVVEKGMLKEDETVQEQLRVIEEKKALIAADKERINVLKNMKPCPVCGAAAARNAKYCSECGADISAVEAAGQKAAGQDAAGQDAAGQKAEEPKAEEPKAEEPRPATVLCPKCGSVIPGDAGFCPQCGEKIER